MAGIRGDFAQLQALRGKLERLADGTFIRALRVRLGAEAVTLVADEFEAQRDPYGRQWKPSNGFGPSTMMVTGGAGLRGSFSAQATAAGFAIGTEKKYAAIHQYGGIIEAKNGKYLKFKVPVSSRIATTRGGKYRRLKRPSRATVQAHVQWIQVKSVRIPQRQMVPEGTLGDTWSLAFTRESEALLEDAMK